jgi:predicted metalloprotease with PDZ domain
MTNNLFVTPTMLNYVIDFADSPRHLANIALWIPLAQAEEVELVFPVWTPGSYMVREYTRNIESMQASCCDDADLPADRRVSVSLRRDGKNRWIVKPTQSQGWLVIEYRLYCRENSVRTNWLECDYGFITGAATFPWVEGAADQPIQLLLKMPDHWSGSASSLHRQPSRNGFVHYLAKNYHELVDSPIVCGNFEEREIEVSQHRHVLVHVGADDLWDLDRAAQDVKTIVATQHEFWREIPYDSYYFLNLCTEAGGGLEHDNCTVLMCSRWAMRRRESYLNWLALVSHEFFHTWNVRRLRPRALMNYDYESEQFFEELWIAEGITSYFDDLLLVRSGLCTTYEYLVRLTANIQAVQNAPGRLVQDLAGASWDTWIKHYRPDENSHNSRISYYLKGCVLAWLLDARVRCHSNNQVSLDDIVRNLWSEYRHTGYSLADFEDVVEAMSNSEIRQWLDEQVRNAADLDLSIALQHFGLRFQQLPESESAFKSVTKVWIGSESTPTEGKLYVRRVFRNSPSDRAGLNVDDELISFDGYRVTPDTWPSRLEVYEPDDQIELLISRRGKIRTLQIVLGSKPEHNWQLEVDPQADAANLEQWLGLER